MFTLEGTVSVKINNTGRVIDDTITFSDAGSIAVRFLSSDRSEVFEGSLTLSLGGVFTAAGTVRFIRRPSGQLDIDIPDASIDINIPDGSGGFEQAFGINGSARFSLGGDQGFRLQDVRVNGFTIFSQTATIASPAVQLRPPTADLSLPYENGVFNTAEFNERGYIEVVYHDLNGGGLNAGTITDAGPQEFFLTILPEGSSTPVTPESLGILINGAARQVASDTFQYDFTGTFPDGVVTVVFAPEQFADSGGSTNVTDREQFALDTPSAPGGSLPSAKPTAQLSNPLNGAQVTLSTLIAKRYLERHLPDARRPVEREHDHRRRHHALRRGRS